MTASAPARSAELPGGAAARRRKRQPDRLGFVLVGLLIGLVPVAMGDILWASPGGVGDFNRRIAVAPFDAVLLALIGMWAHRLPPAREWHLAGASWPMRLVAAFGAVLVVALAAHPSPLGVALLVRLVGLVAVASTMASARYDAAGRRTLLGAIAAVGVVQAALAMAQSARGVPLGLGPLEFAGPLYPFGSSFAGRGGLDHPYHLACLLVMAAGAAVLGAREAVGRWRWVWLTALAALCAGMAVTYSRAAILGSVTALAVAVAGGVRHRDRALLLVAAAVAGGLALGAMSFGDGWVAKGEVTGDSTQVDTGRRDRLQEAGRLIRLEPLIGVGPGRYVEALGQVEHDERLPAHNLVAHTAAETGMVGGLLAGALLGALAWRTVRAGRWPMVVFLLLAPFFLLDAYPYVFATGLAVTAVWLGLLVLAGVRFDGGQRP